MKKMALILAILTLVAAPAWAQADQKPLSGYIAGGYSATKGDTADALTDGWNFSGGVIMRPRPEIPFAVRADIGYNFWDATNQIIDSANGSGAQVRIDDGWASMFTVTADAMWEFGGDKVGGYIGAGLGAYRRYATLTQEVLVGGWWCDPWTGWCYPVTSIGDAIVQDDKLTKIGYNGAVGITFNLSSGSQMYLEARYHRMDSETPTEYVPFTVGYRW